MPALLILLTHMNYRFALESPGGNDFLSGWTAAKSWLETGMSPYDPQVRNEVQNSIYGRSAIPEAGEFLGYFPYPLPAILIFAPFTILQFELARAIWMTLLEVGLLVLAIFGHRLARWTPSTFLLIGFFLFSLVWYHGVRVVILGPISILVAILIAGALLAIKGNNDWIAGLLFALGVGQPQQTIVIIIAVCLWAMSVQRWQLLLSIIGFHILILGISVILMPSWPFEWIEQTIELLNNGATFSVSEIISDSIPQFSSWLRLGIPGVLGILLLWEWIQVWGKNVDWFTWTAAFTIAISILFTPHFSTEDYVILLPVVVMIFGHWDGRWGASGKFVIWISMFTLSLGLWALFFSAPAFISEPSILYFPIPLFCILGLLWVRWWVTRKHQRFPLSF